jgi:glycosyltransferase involved in cell wall biosynthesis
MTLPLTAIILTYNEASNMAPCLAALANVDDVVLVDSGSRDNTVALAQNLRPDIRVFEHPFEDFGAQRNWALDHATPRYPWVLFVDADEYCEPELLREIADFIGAPGRIVGAYIAGKNYFLGTWLRRTTFYPSYQLRLLKLGRVRYRKEGHGQREVTDGDLCYLRNGWRHEGFSKGVHQWVARHNQYSTDEVDLILSLRKEPIELKALVVADPIRRRRALKVLASRVPARPLWRFVYTYVIKRGFLDGKAGLDYCLLRVAHDLHIGVKIRERRVLSGPDS